MSLGNTLRAAREACGITTSELAARTHMLVQIVEGLENEDFRRIPAPIYGRGFIKLYCEAVNIDPKPLQAEFMELFNKAKDAPPKAEFPAGPSPKPVAPPAPTLAQEPVAASESQESTDPDATNPPPPPAEEAPAPSPEPDSRSMAEFGDLFAQPVQPPPAVRPPAQPAAVGEPAPPKRSYGDLFGQTYAAKEETVPRTSAAEKFRNTMSNVSSGVFANVQNLPPNTGRIVTVSVCAIIVFSLIGWGVFELYKATTPTGGETPARTEAVVEADAEKPKATPKVKKDEPQKETKSAKKPLPSKPGELKASGIEIPSLYID